MRTNKDIIKEFKKKFSAPEPMKAVTLNNETLLWGHLDDAVDFLNVVMMTKDEHLKTCITTTLEKDYEASEERVLEAEMAWEKLMKKNLKKQMLLSARTLRETRQEDRRVIINEFISFLKEEYGYKGEHVSKIKMSHGVCCCCSECGHYHDECVCESNRIHEFITKLIDWK